MTSEAAEPSTVVLSIRATGVALVELNRPLKCNSLSQRLIDELTGVLRRLDQDPNTRAIVLTSVDNSPFCGMSSASPGCTKQR
jgi:enoyl-CoA hydratase